MTDADGNWLWHNRQNWNDRVRVHSGSDFYDLPRFREGVSTLRPFEIPEVGDVAGRRLVHLQCHMGQDTLSWARLGADVTGLDFSEDAIRTARELAADIGMADRARFVVSDVYEAPSALDGELFDIVYTGLGALVWLPDLTSWASTAASLLKEEGALYLAEFHPLTELLEEDGRTVEHDYFQSEGRTCESPFTYTDGPTLTRTTSVQWQHTLGGVVTALAGAGLRIEFLHEHETLLFKRFPLMERHGSLDYRFPEGHPRLPLMYSIRAVKGS